jgi:hypothetical protein
MLYRGLELSVDCDSRIALVGPNGAGERRDEGAGGEWAVAGLGGMALGKGRWQRERHELRCLGPNEAAPHPPFEFTLAPFLVVLKLYSPSELPESSEPSPFSLSPPCSLTQASPPCSSS